MDWIREEMKKDAADASKAKRTIDDLMKEAVKPQTAGGSIRPGDVTEEEVQKELQDKMFLLLDKLGFDAKFDDAWAKAPGIDQLPEAVKVQAKTSAKDMCKKRLTAEIAKAMIEKAVKTAIEKGPATAAGSAAAGTRAVVPAAAAAAPQFKTGDHVQAKWQGGSFYAGVVQVKNADGTYHVTFDDGDQELKEPAANIKYNEFTAGANLAVRYAGDGQYYGATFVSKGAAGKINITWHADGSQDIVDHGSAKAA